MTVLGYLIYHFQTKPDAVALRNSEHSLTYGELCNCMINYLNSPNPYSSDEIIVLSIKDQMRWVVSLLGLLFRGCWVLLVPEDFRSQQLKDCQLPFKIFQEIAIDTSKPGADVSCLKEPEQCCGIYQVTSGSTGKPILCKRTLLNLTNEGLRYQKYFSVTEKDAIINIPPLYHSYSFGAALMTAIISGVPLTVVNAVAPRKIHWLVKEHGITFMVVVPNIVRLLLIAEGNFQEQYQGVQTVLVGAGAVSEAAKEQFFIKFGVPLWGNYGSTETGALFCRKPEESVRSLGRPMPDISYLIKDEAGNLVRPGNIGELFVKYDDLVNPVLYSEKPLLDEAGYFPMGDLVMEDEKHCLYLVGRKKLIINMGGQKVYPIEVESVIKSCFGVEDCIVLPVKKKCQDVRIKAIIQSNVLSEADIRNYCQNQLPLYKQPAVIRICRQIPRNELGKVNYFELENL